MYSLRAPGRPWQALRYPPSSAVGLLVLFLATGTCTSKGRRRWRCATRGCCPQTRSQRRSPERASSSRRRFPSIHAAHRHRPWLWETTAGLLSTPPVRRRWHGGVMPIAPELLGPWNSGCGSGCPWGCSRSPSLVPPAGPLCVERRHAGGVRVGEGVPPVLHPKPLRNPADVRPRRRGGGAHVEQVVLSHGARPGPGKVVGGVDAPAESFKCCSVGNAMSRWRA